MTPTDGGESNECRIQPATHTPVDLELKRRLVLLSDTNISADCAASTAPILKRLLIWAVVAAAVWLTMIFLGH